MQTKMMREIRDDLNAAADSINQIELIRAQLGTLTSVLGADASARAIRTAADDLDKKLMAVEENLFQMRVTGRGQDVFRWGPRLVEKITHLASGVSSSDFPPTTQQATVQRQLGEQAGSYKNQLDELVAKDVAAFNALLREKGLQNIIVR